MLESVGIPPAAAGIICLDAGLGYGRVRVHTVTPDGSHLAIGVRRA